MDVEHGGVQLAEGPQPALGAGRGEEGGEPLSDLEPGPSVRLVVELTARPGPTGVQAMLKAGTPDEIPLNSSPLTPASSLGDHMESRWISPVTWNPPMTQMSPP